MTQDTSAVVHKLPYRNRHSGRDPEFSLFNWIPAGVYPEFSLFNWIPAGVYPVLHRGRE